MIDGAMAGGSAGHDRDGYDLFSFMVARKAIIESVDIESFESRYPALVLEKRPRTGAEGAGRFRAGAGCQMSYRPHKTASWTGVMLGMRERLPLPGFAGGRPGANTEFVMRKSDGRRESISGHEGALLVAEGDAFEFLLGSGGGFGDPLDRDPDAVVRDVRQFRISRDEAKSVYGVVLDERDILQVEATRAQRTRLLDARLDNSLPAPKPITDRDILSPGLRGTGHAGNRIVAQQFVVG